MNDYIPLNREFSLIEKNTEINGETFELEDYSGIGRSITTWKEIETQRCCVILAPGGSGKTEEFVQQAKAQSSKGRRAFFMRIEDINNNFESAFEEGTHEEFREWLDTPGEEAWFYLDSVDEARLEGAHKFRQALKVFVSRASHGLGRAHVFISSRPYAWSDKPDRGLVSAILKVPLPDDSENDETYAQVGQNEIQSKKTDVTLKVYRIRALDDVRIRQFCDARDAKNIDELLKTIERHELKSLAQVPFDLDNILRKWQDHAELGGRLKLLEYNIECRLMDTHNPERAHRQPLNLEHAMVGACRLAAATFLMGQTSIQVPNGAHEREGLDAKVVLGDWNPKDVQALLERGIFNAMMYGTVRFAQREIRELLAAKWFKSMLDQGGSRLRIERLFLKNQYGIDIVTPSLRTVLPWLIIFDDTMRKKVLDVAPEVATEGGEPSRLPFSVRSQILTDMVTTMAERNAHHSGHDNDAINRIANADLSDVTKSLIERHFNDEAVMFYLGRLVWKGEMSSCAAPLIDIALKGQRDIYSRTASVRAVMSCGTTAQKAQLWDGINTNTDKIPRRLLAEVLSQASTDDAEIDRLIVSMGHLTPYKRFEGTGLSGALHNYTDRLHVDNKINALVRLMDGFHDYLEKEPYIDRQECYVSKEYAWLLNPAVHVVEVLIKNRDPAALQVTAIDILLKDPILQLHNYDDRFDRYEGQIAELVPAWPELNDCLYWASIALGRKMKGKYGWEFKTDIYCLTSMQHHWRFDSSSWPRLISFMKNREHVDDRLLAFTTAFGVYAQLGEPEEWLVELNEAVSGETKLQERFDQFTGTESIEQRRKNEAMRQKNVHRQKKELAQREELKQSRIEQLNANIEVLRCPPDEHIVNAQIWLMDELRESRVSLTREGYPKWRSLIDGYGETIATAYRDAAVGFWRRHTPSIWSKSGEYHSISYSLLFAMAGIEIEADENPDFPICLTETEVDRVLRYAPWEINGLPRWLESIFTLHPDKTSAFFIQEIKWQLENFADDQVSSYMLEKVVYHAPWLIDHITPWLRMFLASNIVNNHHLRHHLLQLLNSSNLTYRDLSEIANAQLRLCSDNASSADWYAMLVDSDPDDGIERLRQWLASLNENKSTDAACTFITSLRGSSFGQAVIAKHQLYRTAKHLKALYLLMYQYIRPDDDINRSGGGSYSPTPRDDAQDARNSLFHELSKLQGKESYQAIVELSREHPDPKAHDWMREHAYHRAVSDGDIEPWDYETQLLEFEQRQVLTPSSHKELYNLVVDQLHDMKDWLENSNLSPYKLWRTVESETILRTTIASHLEMISYPKYTLDQEFELANGQRMDISVVNNNSRPAVPIELKLLDKKWTGPALEHSLENQLIGDYLREPNARCGVFLLVWTGLKPARRWRINNKNIALEDLSAALEKYWLNIAGNHPDLDEIRVIVIDLGKRDIQINKDNTRRKKGDGEI